ncbi:MAG TPA: SgcJ/EcaC family oxidoreductase [Pirellulales bacterium]|nr:SgcJ/EcaC family oxidoreductase [Pirellulales bacterium]
MFRTKFVLLFAAASLLFPYAAENALAQAPKANASSPSASPNPMSKDESAIRAGAAEFSRAFEKGDAKAIAAMWVANGEYEDDQNEVLRGRDAIEKAYTEQFAEKKGGKIDIDVQSVRFLTPDVAVEEGILHESSAARELPTTTRYAAIDVREGGQWKIAQCREWGGGQDHLDDLNWLVGKWQGSSKDQEMNLSFAWDDKQPLLLAKISAKPVGKSGGAGQVAGPSGTIKIGYDARRGGFHSWHSNQDGSQSRAQWQRDGYRWLIDATGLTSDGKDLTAEYVLTRVDNNNFTWRAVSRKVGGQLLPDSLPIKLTRVTESK